MITLFVTIADYPVDFSSKGSACNASAGIGIKESKEQAGQNKSSLNNDNERNRRYLSDVSDVDDDDEMDEADDEIIDIVGDHSHVMTNGVQRNYEPQRFF